MRFGIDFVFLILKLDDPLIPYETEQIFVHKALDSGLNKIVPFVLIPLQNFTPWKMLNTFGWDIF